MDVLVDDLRIGLYTLPLAWRLVAPVAFLLLVSWMVGWLNRRRQSAAMSHALGNSTRGRVVSRSGPNARGLVAEIEPAPEPFGGLLFRFAPRSHLSPAGVLGLLQGGYYSTLNMQGMLHAMPDAELVWIRKQVPDKALGKDPGSALWATHRLDFINLEYATRGANTAALRHAFAELQTRFGPILQHVTIQRDEEPMVDILVRTDNLVAEEIPALVAAVRAMGRAAELR